MNRDLTELIEAYGTKTHNEVTAILNNKSKQNLISMLLDLTTQYFNDKNSSTLREFLVVTLSEFTPLQEKIGYNGYRHLGISDKKDFCEAKPKNITADKKLDGGGNFTDYSWKTFGRHKKENPTMLVGGFIEGRLIYIFSFKFNSMRFVKRIQEQLERNFPDGDENNKFLRSASFSLTAYQDSADLEVKTFITKKQLAQYAKNLTKGVYNLLKQNL